MVLQWMRLQQVHFPVPYKVLQSSSAGCASSCHVSRHTLQTLISCHNIFLVRCSTCLIVMETSHWEQENKKRKNQNHQYRTPHAAHRRHRAKCKPEGMVPWKNQMARVMSAQTACLRSRDHIMERNYLAEFK